MAKLQTVLPSMTTDDKETLAEYAKEKDPNVLQVLYFNVKESNPILANKIMKQLNDYTRAEQIAAVEGQLEEIKGLESYLSFDYIKALDTSYQAVEYLRTQPEGAVNRIIGAYIEAIDKRIAYSKIKEDAN
nr:hypothetical protein [uncultured Aminipila sp.]